MGSDSGDGGLPGPLAALTEAFGREIAQRDPRAAIPWPTWPDIGSVVDHLGDVHRWAAEIVRTGTRVPEGTMGRRPDEEVRTWYAEGRARLLATLAVVPPDTPCWVLGNRIGTAAFWRRRMVHETAKHLIDVRASGGGRAEAAPELHPQLAADGVDELFEEFLPRTVSALKPLPGSVLLQATDIGRAWWIGRDWTISTHPGDGTDASARVLATAGDLALAVWERADPVDDDRYRVEGDRAAVAAFRAAPVHP